MKANRPYRIAWLIALAALPILTSSCSSPRILPPPREPAPRPAPLPPAPSPPIADWRDAPITPGTWSWASESGQSVARFADGKLELRCDRANDAVRLKLAGFGAGAVTITTSSLTRTVPGTADAGGASLRIERNDPLLDAIAFSRGRFVIGAANTARLYVPSWPEISRVVEDCR